MSSNKKQLWVGLRSFDSSSKTNSKRQTEKEKIFSRSPHKSEGRFCRTLSKENMELPGNQKYRASNLVENIVFLLFLTIFKRM